MPSEFGAFDKLTEAFATAAVDPAHWDAAMDIASEATGSLGAILVPLRGRTPNLPKSQSMCGVAEDYVGAGWVHRDERSDPSRRSCVAACRRNSISPHRRRWRRPFIIRTSSAAMA